MRKTAYVFCLSLSTFLLAGCNREGASQAEPSKRGMEVNAPGVKVKVGPEGKTDVEAPGTKVKVDPKKDDEKK